MSGKQYVILIKQTISNLFLILINLSDTSIYECTAVEHTYLDKEKFLSLFKPERFCNQWQDHLSKKPDPSAMPPGAAEALKEAESSIGNKLLKTQPEYVAPPGHNTQLRICLLRQEVIYGQLLTLVINGKAFAYG